MAYGHKRFKGDKIQVLGYKRGMTTYLKDDGTAHGVTLIEFADARVTQVKTPETDGYTAVQVGVEPVAEHRLTKAELGHLKAKNGGSLPAYRKLLELRDVPVQEIGSSLSNDLFQPSTLITVRAKTKGKGFAGVVKRYHFHGQNATHGVSQVHRKPMTGGATDAARTMPGSRRPGHMGDEFITVRNLRIVARDEDLNIIAIEGAIPGPTNGLLTMTFQGEFVEKKQAFLGQRVGQQKQKKK